MIAPFRSSLRAMGPLLALAVLAAAGRSAAGTVYDLTADWSDTANPNGPWSYREGANLLPHVDAWQGLAGDFTSAQPAWARFDVGTSNLPCIFRSSGTVGIVHDWLTGDVVCHSTDSFNGIGSGTANITWTSPVTGTVAVSGAIWMGRDIGRGNHWSLLLHGSTLTGGDIASGDPYSRVAPMNFAAGSGGAGALSSLAVQAGDVIELDIVKTATPGDYACIQMQVQLVQPSGVGNDGSAHALSLEAPLPNPARADVALRFSLPAPQRGSLEVDDLQGRRVATVADGEFAAGPQGVTWSAGVPAGLYFIRLHAGGKSLTRRLVVVR